MSLNVFGRTLGPGNTDGRQHNQNHQVSITIGKPFAGGVIGGVGPVSERLRGAGDRLQDRKGLRERRHPALGLPILLRPDPTHGRGRRIQRQSTRPSWAAKSSRAPWRRNSIALRGPEEIDGRRSSWNLAVTRLRVSTEAGGVPCIARVQATNSFVS